VPPLHELPATPLPIIAAVALRRNGGQEGRHCAERGRDERGSHYRANHGLVGETRGSVVPVWKRKGSSTRCGKKERRGNRRAATVLVVEERESKGSSAAPAVERGSAGKPPDIGSIVVHLGHPARPWQGPSVAREISC
jgi:hypothetical protein